MLPRRAIVVRDDDPHVTLRKAQDALRELPETEVLWAESPKALRAVAGGDFSAVVLDLHQRLSLDALGLAHGLVRGGGCLVLRLPHQSPPDRRALATPPYPATAAGQRTWQRLQSWLEAAPTQEGTPRLAPAVHKGTGEQAELVETLAACLARAQDAPSAHVVVADRGRGKSAALGMLWSQLPEACTISLTAPSQAQLISLKRFAPHASYVAPLEVPDVDILVVDEAAGLAVPTLQRLVARARHVVMASTVHGYEGHGRGFSLRFLPWLQRQRTTRVHALRAPIRWATNDPLERWIFDGLLLDAAPAPQAPGPYRWSRLERDALAGDEALLREVFGLLVAAHYRTTPDDLMRLLDAANLEVHVLRGSHAVAAACLVAREGRLTDEDLAPLLRGEHRLRGQALAETLARHSAEPEAGRWDLRRNLRTAVHPAHRREGLGARLAQAIHQNASPDAFGTMFGATAGLLAFRRAQGYRLVRLGATRSDRSGLMSVVMLRPGSKRAEQLVRRLRRRLSVDLPHQLLLASAEHAIPPALEEALRKGLTPDASLTDEEHRVRLQRYLSGTQTDWAIAGTLARAVEDGDACNLTPEQRALWFGRLRDQRAWRDLARDGSVRMAMRGLREAAAIVAPTLSWVGG